jgi:hypothetical protein
MQFMMMVKSKENQGMPPQGLMDAMSKLVEKAVQEGRMVFSGGLMPTAMCSKVRIEGGKISTIDGPFTEAKEVVGGFAIMNYDSKKDAVEAAVKFIELHRQHWPGWKGESEVRQMYGPDDMPHSK